MSQLTRRVGEKTRSEAVIERPAGNDSRFKKRTKTPAAYLATHRCKVCDGKLCTGHCKF